MPRTKEQQREYMMRKKGNYTPGPDKVECLLCHRYFRKVGAHIFMTHGITRLEYCEQFGLDRKRGLLTEIERKVLRDHIYSNGTINNLKKGEVYRYKKGDKRAGRYTRSKQTMDRLQKHIKTINKYDKF